MALRLRLSGGAKPRHMSEIEVATAERWRRACETQRNALFEGFVVWETLKADGYWGIHPNSCRRVYVNF